LHALLFLISQFGFSTPLLFFIFSMIISFLTCVQARVFALRLEEAFLRCAKHNLLSSEDNIFNLLFREINTQTEWGRIASRLKTKIPSITQILLLIFNITHMTALYYICRYKTIVTGANQLIIYSLSI